MGGVLGTVFILAQLFAAEQLGSAVFMRITVTAAVGMSLLLDHCGLVGFKEHPLGWGRVAGAMLISAGLGLIARYRSWTSVDRWQRSGFRHRIDCCLISMHYSCISRTVARRLLRMDEERRR